MPTYDYQCRKCGRVFEAFHSMSAPSLTECEDPECRGEVVRLVGGGAGLIFKGSGFYITDYKKTPAGGEKAAGAEATAKKAEGKSEAAGGAKSDTKSESKSETKSETKAEAKKPATTAGNPP